MGTSAGAGSGPGEAGLPSGVGGLLGRLPGETLLGSGDLRGRLTGGGPSDSSNARLDARVAVSGRSTAAEVAPAVEEAAPLELAFAGAFAALA
jgi:hypothetical protein